MGFCCIPFPWVTLAVILLVRCATATPSAAITVTTMTPTTRTRYVVRRQKMFIMLSGLYDLPPRQ